MEDANETIASLEDHLEDLKLKAVSKSSSGEDTIDRDESGSAPKATVEEQIKKDEQYWRKRWRRIIRLARIATTRAIRHVSVLRRRTASSDASTHFARPTNRPSSTSFGPSDRVGHQRDEGDSLTGEPTHSDAYEKNRGQT